MSIQAVRKAVREARKDTFDIGTVIRWEVDARYNVFLYAAIKTPVGWVTTARPGNNFVPETVDFDALLEILGRDEVCAVSVSQVWESVMIYEAQEDDLAGL